LLKNPGPKTRRPTSACRALHSYPRIFHHIQHLKPGAGGELQLTDAIAALLKEQQCWPMPSTHPLRLRQQAGYLQATVEYALKHSEVSEDFAAYLKPASADQSVAALPCSQTAASSASPVAIPCPNNAATMP